MDRMRLAADERADIAAFLEGLTVEQWELPTACPGWRVRDVAAQVPAERLRQALPFALRAPTLPGRRLGQGLSFVATDLDWRAGHGPEVRGPGEAVLMAVAGRREALAELAELAGDGLDRLVARSG